MSEDRNEASSSRMPPIIAWTVAASLVAVLYVLSMGPAVMLRDRGMLAQATFLSIYAPITWLIRFAPLNYLLESYLSLWTK